MNTAPSKTTSFAAIRGGLTVGAVVVNTLLWAIPIYLGALFKLVLPRGAIRDVLRRNMIRSAENWIRVNNFIFSSTQATRWRVRGLDGISPDGRYLVIANHQSWADIPILQRAFSRRIPFLKFFIKQELIWVPVLGLAWWGLEFPFMKRYSSEFLKKHPELRGKDLETTRQMCESLGDQPLSIMNFLEGTRFTTEKRDEQASPYEHLLKPKAGGIAFVLGAIGTSLDAILDVTITYRGAGRSLWDLCCGRIDAIEVAVIRREIPPALVDRDYYADEAFRNGIQDLVRQIWTEKDAMIKAAVRSVALAVTVTLGLATVSYGLENESRPRDAALASDYDRALAAYESGRYQEARNAFEALAGQGVAQAEFMLGVLYEYGDGVAASFGQAAAWYRAAADKGLTSAETRLGFLYLEGKGVSPDPAQARLWFERAARKRDPAAYKGLGDMHARGQGVSQSQEEAYAYYLLADAAGSTEAAKSLYDLEHDLSAGKRDHARSRARAIVESLAGTVAPASITPASAAARSAGALALTTTSVHDDGLAANALHLLVPAGWTVRGGIEWRSDAALPAQVELTVSNDVGVALETLPKGTYAWHFEAGEKKKPFLALRGFESRPPVGDAVVFLERMVLPERHEFSGASVLERQSLPSVARVVATELARRGRRVDVSAARVRITYEASGAPMEADLFAVLTQERTPSAGEEVIKWGPEHLYLYRAPAGRLAANAAILDAIAASMRFDDVWWARYEALLEELRDRPGRSRISAREFELFLESAKGARAGPSAGSAVREAGRIRFHAAMAAELGRVEMFFDPAVARDVAFPKGYARVWAGSKGRYRAASSPDEDPSQGDPAGDWVELHAVSSR